MNIREIRDMSNAELKKALEESQKELFDLRFEKATSSLSNPMKIRELRKTIARIKTVLHESEVERG